MDAPFYGPVQAVAVDKARRPCYSGASVKHGRAPSLREDNQSQ